MAVAGCAAQAPVVQVEDGFTHITANGTFDCQGRPVAVDGSHRDVTLQGNCRRVRLTGSHVDLIAYVEPGATIDVTGSHDTIIYRLTRRGPPPRLNDQGAANELLRNSRLSWQQDHDWYQERH